MANYLLLKHYRGAPAAVNDVPMDQWTPEEISSHVQYMNDFAARLENTGEFVDGQALAPEGTFVRYDGEGRPPVTDGPFAETKDLIAGWMVIAAEDAVQDALVEAIRVWPDDPPGDPKAWLVTVAWRRFLDAARSQAARRRREEVVEEGPAPGPVPAADDTLQLYFLCAHPSLTPSSAVALTLRAVGGLDAPDRPGLSRTRGHHGAAHQQGKADRLGRAVRQAR